MVTIIATFVRLEQGLQLPADRFIAGAFSGHAITSGNFGVLLTSTLLTRDVFMVASICVSLLVAMGGYEVIAGHTRALLLAVFAAAAGPLSVVTGLGLLSGLGSHWALTRMDTLDIGASAIVAASSGAIAGIARYRKLTAGLVLFLLGGLLVHHQLADWEHVLIFPWGYLAGRLFSRAPLPREAGRRGRPRRVAWYGIAAVLLSGCSVVASASALPAGQVYRSASGAILSRPRILDTTYPSPAMHGSRQVIVLLPPGYGEGPRQRYPVVVFLHGDPSTPQALMQLGHLEADEAAPGTAPFIGIVPDGNGPVVQSSWWVDIPRQHLGTSVAVDLRHWVRGHYRTDGSYSYAGFSSGALGAAYLPLLDPLPVHAVCGLSGFYQGTRIPPLRRDAAAQRAAGPILNAAREPGLTFLSYGRRDGTSRAQTTAYAAALRAAGKQVRITTEPGGHDWSVWRAAFRQCLGAIVPAGGRGPVGGP